MAKITNREWELIKAIVDEKGIYNDGIYEIKREDYGYTLYANYEDCRLKIDAARDINGLKHTLYIERQNP